MSTSTRTALILFFLLAVAAPLAWAQPKPVELNVVVTLVSNEGKQVDPQLMHLAADFRQKHLSYSSFSVVSNKKLTLNDGGSGDVPLPNGKKLVLTLVKREADGRAHLKMAVPDVGNMEFDLASSGELIQDGGPYQKGELFFVIRR